MAIDAKILREVIADQARDHQLPADYINRDQEPLLDDLAQNKEIVVITGVRRCGKSVLMQQLRRKHSDSDYYLNFEDERLVNFTLEDFQTLFTTLIELFGEQKHFYFDEIQNIPGWEMFVRRLYNAGNKIFITGSNANLFSEELGTRLTGRYIPIEIYPLSFRECVRHQLPEALPAKAFSTVMTGKLQGLFQDYLNSGGIPEYTTHRRDDYLQALYNSILYKDIVARYKITNDTALKKLVFFLASNCSKETSFNALKKAIDIKSTSTVSAYCSYLETSYLCFFVNRYSESTKKQLQSPKKTYFIDHAIARTLGFRFSDDMGRILENIVFIELKRRHQEIFYYQEKKECDFIVRDNNRTMAAIQVCQQPSNPDTKKREIAGLLEALKHFSLNTGYILTEHEEITETHTLDEQTYTVQIIPIWKWLLNVT